MIFLLTMGSQSLPIYAQPTDVGPAFSDFDDWWQVYTTVAASERPGMVKKGTALAKTRSNAMLQLIENDPSAAIQKAFAEEYRSALPKSVSENIELHVRGLAKLTVTKKDGTTSRKVTMGEESWKAFFYGPRLELNSRAEIPIHGVTLAGRIAVDGSPLERFPKRETLLSVLREGEGKKTCPICGEPGVIPSAVGDVLLWFDTEEHQAVCEKALVEKEMSPESED
ncbi:MAG: hypothetical protein ABIT76_02440 [Chthoniobacterales bacterium]